MKTFEEHKNAEYDNIMMYLSLLTDNKFDIEYDILNEDYSRCDLIYKLNGKVYMVEFKNRDVTQFQYRDTLCEMDKLIGIKQQAKELNISNPTILFVTKFKNGEMYEFNMEEYTRVAETLCPKHTSIDGNNEKVLKDCIYFNIKFKNKIK